MKKSKYALFFIFVLIEFSCSELVEKQNFTLKNTSNEVEKSRKKISPWKKIEWIIDDLKNSESFGQNTGIGEALEGLDPLVEKLNTMAQGEQYRNLNVSSIDVESLIEEVHHFFSRIEDIKIIFFYWMEDLLSLCQFNPILGILKSDPSNQDSINIAVETLLELQTIQGLFLDFSEDKLRVYQAKLDSVASTNIRSNYFIEYFQNNKDKGVGFFRFSYKKIAEIIEDCIEIYDLTIKKNFDSAKAQAKNFIKKYKLIVQEEDGYFDDASFYAAINKLTVESYLETLRSIIPSTGDIMDKLILPGSLTKDGPPMSSPFSETKTRVVKTPGEKIKDWKAFLEKKSEIVNPKDGKAISNKTALNALNANHIRASTKSTRP